MGPSPLADYRVFDRPATSLTVFTSLRWRDYGNEVRLDHAWGAMSIKWRRDTGGEPHMPGRRSRLQSITQNNSLETDFAVFQWYHLIMNFQLMIS